MIMKICKDDEKWTKLDFHWSVVQNRGSTLSRRGVSGNGFGGQNGVAVGPSGAQGTPLSAFFSHWEVRIRVLGVQNWLGD